MNQSFSQQELNEMLNRLSQKAKTEDINNLSKQSPQELLKKLSAEDAAKIKAVMKDKEAMNNLLNSPQAKALMKMINKGKGGK